MRIQPDAPNTLLFTYWGKPPAGTTWEMLVDKTLIASVTVHNGGDKFIDRLYPIPSALLRGKTEVTILLKAAPGQTVGPLYDCRMLR